MHNLLVQCLIALISKEFSPEEFREILEETNDIPLPEKLEYWKITNQLDQAMVSLRARFKHPQNKVTHRELVKDVVVRQAMPEVPYETPVDWQPRPVLKASMDFS